MNAAGMMTRVCYSDFYYAALVVLKERHLLHGKITRRYKKSSQEIPHWQAHAMKLAVAVGLCASKRSNGMIADIATPASNLCQQLVLNASLQEVNFNNTSAIFQNLCIVIEVGLSPTRMILWC